MGSCVWGGGNLPDFRVSTLWRRGLTLGFSSPSVSAANPRFLPLGLFCAEGFRLGEVLFEELGDLGGLDDLGDLGGCGLAVSLVQVLFDELDNHDGLGDLGGCGLALGLATALSFFPTSF